MSEAAPLTAIFGGTFDPVHYGHLRAASEVAEMLRADDFRLLPCGVPAHRGGPKATPAQRLDMLHSALKPHPDLKVDDRETRRPGISYMVDTLTEIRGEIGQAPLALVVGQDSANSLERWNRWEELFALAHLVMMTRPNAGRASSSVVRSALAERLTEDVGSLRARPAGSVIAVEVTQLAISSTEIRRQLEMGADPRFLLPDEVLRYIRGAGLYQ